MTPTRSDDSSKTARSGAVALATGLGWSLVLFWALRAVSAGIIAAGPYPITDRYRSELMFQTRWMDTMRSPDTWGHALAVGVLMGILLMRPNFVNSGFRLWLAVALGSWSFARLRDGILYRSEPSSAWITYLLVSMVVAAPLTWLLRQSLPRVEARMQELNAWRRSSRWT